MYEGLNGVVHVVFTVIGQELHTHKPVFVVSLNQNKVLRVI